MDVFEQQTPSLDTLVKLNAVRLYLGVLTLADITNNEGMHIFPWTLTGKAKAKPMLPWPKQGMLSDKFWVIWCRYLKLCFALNTSCSHHLNTPIKLDQQLGEWKTKTAYTARQYYDAASSSIVYMLQDGLFCKY
eukprot:14070992-Ditylum_brightwellii.AAC.1